MTNEKIDWHRSEIDGGKLRSLTAQSNFLGLCQAGGHLLLVAALGAVAYYAMLNWPWPAAVAALYLYGTVFAFLGLMGAGHELSHRTVFKSRLLGEFFMRVFSFLSWTDFVKFRISHPVHHRYTVYAGLDGEVVLPRLIRPRDWLFIFTIDINRIAKAFLPTVRHSLGLLNDDWEREYFPASDIKGRRALANWARTMLLGHIALAGVFIYFRLWPMLLLVTFGAFYGSWLSTLCARTQHTGLMPNVPDYRLSSRSIRLGYLTGFLYWQMQYHIEHHMFPGVPFHKLSALSKVIADDLPTPPPSLLAAWREILPITRRQLKDPQFVCVTELPTPTNPPN